MMFQDEPIMNLQQFVNNYLDITSLKEIPTSVSIYMLHYLTKAYSSDGNYVIAILKDEESYDSLQRGLEDIRNEVEHVLNKRTF